jgi:epoxyqueuosine reductase
LDACPEAIVSPYVVDGSKCISYFTIELKESIPESMKGSFNDWAFVIFVKTYVLGINFLGHNEPLFNPNPDLLS